MASGATYNVTRFTRQVLKRYRRSPPSVVVHLYPNHFRFEHQHGNFGYDSPMKCFLESIREQKLPTDLLDVLDSSSIPYYDGCLIVEVHDHRQYSSSPSTSTQPSTSGAPLSLATLPPSKLFTFSITPSSQSNSPYQQKAEVYRIVLAPNPATLWNELGILSRRYEEDQELGGTGGGGFSHEQAVKMESIILNRTVPPLCLDPSIQTSRIANSMLRATTLRPPKRKRFCNSGECDDGSNENENEEEAEIDDSTAMTGANGGEEKVMSKKEREQYEKLMKVGDEGISKLKGPAFSRLAFIQSYRERQTNPHAASQQQQQPAAAPASASTSLKAQPGSAVTSIRLGSSQAAQSHQNPQGGRSASPAVSTISRPPTKKRQHGQGGGGGGDMSDGATSTTSTTTNSQQKKQKKVVDEKKQFKMQQKRLNKEKERKMLEEQQQRIMAASLAAGGGGGGGGGDLNVGGSSAPQAKFTWSGSPQ
ncbi:hypothetical protein JCM16303_002134 [Sporobolomyces ruberrimus]